jgi:predicted Zn-dependent peptidase
MFQGSAHVASGDHFGLLESTGASVNATTWFDRTNFFETMPVGALDLALWLEADRMATLLAALTEQNFDNQREVVKEEKRQRYDNVPYGDVIELICGQVFESGHPYHHPVIGSMADLDAAEPGDARAFFRAHYSPSNAVLTIVGDIEPAEAFEKAAGYFSAIEAGTPPERPAAVQLPPLTEVAPIDQYAPVPADAVYLTWRIPADRAPGFDALDLCCGVLGQGQAGRLQRRLVRGQEIAESVHAHTLDLIGGNSLAMVGARARDGVTAQQLESALADEVDKMSTEPPTGAELDRAKAQYEREWMHELARIDSRADQISQATCLFSDPGLVNTRFAEFDAVDHDAVEAAVAAWFRPEQRATLRYHRQEAA